MEHIPVLPSMFLQSSPTVQLILYVRDENKRFAEDSPEALGCHIKGRSWASWWVQVIFNLNWNDYFA